MPSPIRDTDTECRRGRPKLASRKDTYVGVRWHPAHIKKIDDWRDAQEDTPPRAEAIRRLVTLGLQQQAPPG
jgi:hypothetical protein